MRCETKSYVDFIPLVDHLVHGAVSLPGAGGVAGASPHTGGCRGRPAVLRHSPVGLSLAGINLDRRSHPDILRIQCGLRGLASPGLLQQVPP